MASALVAGSNPAATTSSYFSKLKGEILEARCLLNNVKPPGTKPCFGMFVRRATDAIDFDSGVYRLGKCRKFYHSGRLAGIIRQLLEFSCLLN